MPSSPTDSFGILNRHPRKVPRTVVGPALHATLPKILAWFDRHVTPYRGMVNGSLSASTFIALRLEQGFAPFDEHLRPGELRDEYVEAIAHAVTRSFPALLAVSIRLDV